MPKIHKPFRKKHSLNITHDSKKKDNLVIDLGPAGRDHWHVLYGSCLMATYISMALSAPVVFYFGRNFFVNAWKQAKHGKANMDTLVALSTGIAFLFSSFNTLFPEFWHARGVHAHVYFEAASVVIAFISLGKLLEEKAKSNTSSAIKKLMGLQPKTVESCRG